MNQIKNMVDYMLAYVLQLKVAPQYYLEYLQSIDEKNSLFGRKKHVYERRT